MEGQEHRARRARPVERRRAECLVASAEVVERLRAGDTRTIARAITLIERGAPGSAQLLGTLRSAGVRRSPVVGVTGPPGAGKSTLIDALTSVARSAGRTVAVVAVDPSSSRSGGAFLGDRVRMLRHVGDPGVYVRSVGSRGERGGLSASTGEIVDLLARLPFDEVLVESVGVGQIEPDMAAAVDTTVVVVTPVGGDDIQVQKAGTGEVADVFAVNKADVDGAADLVRALKQHVALGHDEGGWAPPVVPTVAHDVGSVGSLWTAIEAHRAHLQARADPPGGALRARVERVERTVGAMATAWAHRRLVDDATLTARLLDDEPASSIARELLAPLTADGGDSGRAGAHGRTGRVDGPWHGKDAP